ncbi:MAG: low molecular weight protein-tyrosine-phosphatase [Sandaracinaceae bacterium]
MTEASPIRVCFVCLGNICRSPTAEGVFRRRLDDRGIAERFVVDSAGTGAWHEGERADPRARSAAARRAIELDSIARAFRATDFERFDLVLAMDRRNRRALLAMAPNDEARSKVRLFRSFDPASPEDAEVPDPYYDGGFDHVLDLCEAAAEGLLDALTAPDGPR